MIRSTSRRSTYVCSAAVLLLGILTSPSEARPRPHKKVPVAAETTAPTASETATAPATQAVPEAAPPLAMPAATFAPGAPMGVPASGLVRAAATEPPPVAAFLPPPEPTPPPANAPTAVKGKWSPVFYGFIELDALRDSTQSFQEPAGNGIIQRTETFAGSHGRTMFGVRNSRFGFKLTAPEYEGIKASGILEMDFLGNQPANPPGISEVAFFSNPAFRVRHFALKVETPYLDLLFGQFWQLFGWQSYFHPNTVEIQGLPGQVFARSPQIRVSHLFKTDAIGIEAALSAARPPQRDSQIPDGQGGLRLLVNRRKALHTLGGAGTASDPMGIGLSGVVRRFVLPELTATPAATRSASGWGASLDGLIAIIPGSMEARRNALTLTGSYVAGSGIADLYTGLTGGITAPLYPAPAMGAAVVAPIDAGLVAFDATGALKSIDWTSFMVGL